MKMWLNIYRHADAEGKPTGPFKPGRDLNHCKADADRMGELHDQGQYKNVPYTIRVGCIEVEISTFQSTGPERIDV